MPAFEVKSSSAYSGIGIEGGGGKGGGGGKAPAAASGADLLGDLMSLDDDAGAVRGSGSAAAGDVGGRTF